MSAPVGIVAATPLGEALAARLAADGRQVLVARGDDAAELSALATGARHVLLCAEPSALRRLARALGDHLGGHHLLAHAVRGLLPEGGRPLEVLAEETPVKRLGVLAGPLTAEDLAAGRPSAGVIASTHPEVIEELAEVLSTPRLRVYRGRDPLGAELASGLVDLVALGCGLADALGFGAATRAVMLVRAVREVGRLAETLGGDATTAAGLAGLGDMLVRGADTQGEAYRHGASLAEATGAAGGARGAPPGRLAEVAETGRVVRRIARRERVSTHLLDGLGELLDGSVTTAELVQRLMAIPVLDE